MREKGETQKCSLVDDDQVAIKTKIGDANFDVAGCLKMVNPIVLSLMLIVNLLSKMLSEILMLMSEILILILQIVVSKLWLQYVVAVVCVLYVVVRVFDVELINESVEFFLLLSDVVELIDEEVVVSHLVVDAVCLLFVHLDDDELFSDLLIIDVAVLVLNFVDVVNVILYMCARELVGCPPFSSSRPAGCPRFFSNISAACEKH